MKERKGDVGQRQNKIVVVKMNSQKEEKKLISKRKHSTPEDLASDPDQNDIKDSSDIEEKEQNDLKEGIIESEDRVEGNISFEVAKKWFILSGGPVYYFLVFLAMTIVATADAGSLWFMQYLASDKKMKENSKVYQFAYLFIPYLAILAVMLVGKLVKLVLIFHGHVKLSLEMNFMMTFKTIHASINKYFDRTPMGRILNRFIADVHIVDFELPSSTEIVLTST